MSVPPPFGTVADRRYADVESLAYADPENGYPVAVLVGALCAPIQPVADIAEDTADGPPGMSALLDVERCPDRALPWLAQFPGVHAIPGEDPVVLRDRVRSAEGLRRGTDTALIAAVQRTLTGAKTVRLIGQQGTDGWGLTLITRTAETPDPAATLKVALAAKDAGLILTHVVAAGQTWDEVQGTTWDQAGTVTWDQVAQTDI